MLLRTFYEIFHYKINAITLITTYTPCEVQEIRMDTEAFGKGCYQGVGTK